MAHGYLPEYDDAPDRGDDRERSRRDERERSWRGEDRTRDERGRDFMLGRQEIGRDRDRFREDDRQFRMTHENGWRSEEDDDRNRPRQDFRSSMDHHYRSWRDRQMSELDRDYADYCREREQQFHSDFDEWRRRRHGNPEPLRTGMTQTGISSDPSGEFQLREDQELTPSVGEDPMATATLGEEGGR